MDSYLKTGPFPKHCTHFLGKGSVPVLTLMLRKDYQSFLAFSIMKQQSIT